MFIATKAITESEIIYLLYIRFNNALELLSAYFFISLFFFVVKKE